MSGSGSTGRKQGDTNPVFITGPKNRSRPKPFAYENHNKDLNPLLTNQGDIYIPTKEVH